MISHNEHEFKFLTDLNHSTLCCHFVFQWHFLLSTRSNVDNTICPLCPMVMEQFWNNFGINKFDLVSVLKTLPMFQKNPKVVPILFLKFLIHFMFQSASNFHMLEEVYKIVSIDVLKNLHYIMNKLISNELEII